MDNQPLERIKAYIKQWDLEEGIKPKNDSAFIADFISYLQSRNSDHLEFEGDNDYCGHTAIIHEMDYMGRSWSSSDNLKLELAYGVDFVKVFTGNHNGFWVPEYINLKGGDAAPIIAALWIKFGEWGGFTAKELPVHQR